MASIREYATLYIGGTRTGGATVIGGGNSVLSTNQHALDGPEHTNRGAYVKSFEGGEEGYFAHGDAGSAETIDPTDGNWHSLTLAADCVLSLEPVTAAKGCSLVVEISQDGTGGWGLTLPASVVNASELEAAQDTTASGTTFLVLLTRDGGTNWYGFWAGGGTVVASLDDLTDVAIAAAAAGDFLRHNGSAWVDAVLAVADYPFHAEPLCDSSGPILTSTGDVIMVTGVPN